MLAREASDPTTERPIPARANGSAKASATVGPDPGTRSAARTAGAVDDPSEAAGRRDTLSVALRRAVAQRAGSGERPPEADTARNPVDEALEEEDDHTRNCCGVATGPGYTPTGTIPVTTGGGRKTATFDFASTFSTSTASMWQFWRSDELPDCCEVRQYIKWNKTYHDSKGGPPHGGFPSTAQHGVWYEDRDANDKRYGHRSGTHSDPIAGGGDEYTTNGVQDQAHGDTYNGRDSPDIVASRTGQWQFKLAVIDTCNSNTVKARSSVITINW